MPGDLREEKKYKESVHWKCGTEIMLFCCNLCSYSHTSLKRNPLDSSGLGKPTYETGRVKILIKTDLFSVLLL